MCLQLASQLLGLAHRRRILLERPRHGRHGCGGRPGTNTRDGGSSKDRDHDGGQVVALKSLRLSSTPSGRRWTRRRIVRRVSGCPKAVRATCRRAPSTSPCCVRVDVASLAMPKSSSFTVPSVSRNTLAGFTSGAPRPACGRSRAAAQLRDDVELVGQRERRRLGHPRAELDAAQELHHDVRLVVFFGELRTP